MKASSARSSLLVAVLSCIPACAPDEGEELPAVDDDPALLAQASDAGASASPSDLSAIPPPFPRVYRIPLRIHRADSGLSGAALAAVLEEMNRIWWKQAAICFEVEIVHDQAVRRDGFDMWFHRSRLGCGATGNGVYCGDHDIHTLDSPTLNPVNNPIWDSERNAARTAAHELGHALSLSHYNGFSDSNDSLMSSGRQGFKLSSSEVGAARRRAAQRALPDSSPAACAKVPVVDPR